MAKWQRQLLLLTAMAWTAAGCGDPHDGLEPVQCEGLLLDEVELDFDEQSELGFSAAEAMDQVLEEGQVDLGWEDGGVTQLSWRLDEERDEVTYVELLPDSDPATLDPACGADQYLQIEAVLELTTADGLLDEQWRLYADFRQVDRAELAYTIPVDLFAGDIDVPTASAGDLVHFVSDLSADGLDGALVLQRDDGSDALILDTLAVWPVEE